MKQSTGQTSYHAGLAAEEIVGREYEALGHKIEARRFRKGAGEIDLIASRDGEFVFIEVKKSKTHAQAGEKVTSRQLSRIYEAAAQFLAGQPLGLDTPSRIDVALVDATGRVERLENVYTS